MNVRWLIRRDLEECRQFDGQWTEEDFVGTLRQRNVIGMVAEDQNDSTLEWEIQGFALWKIKRKDSLTVIRIAGNRDGIVKLLKKLQEKAEHRSFSTRVHVTLPLDAELLNAVKACGYRATGCTGDDVQLTWAAIDELPPDDLDDETLKHVSALAYQRRLDSDLGDVF